MDGDPIQIPSAMEMREKQHQPLSFLGRRALAPRPLSEATEIFDTDNEEESDYDYSTPNSLQSLENASQSTASSPDLLQTPLSGGLGGFEFHFDEKVIRGPSGPHLFRHSPDIQQDLNLSDEVDLFADMRPVVENPMQVEVIQPSLLERPKTPKTRPFSSLNRAVAELDETQVRDWTTPQVADWMREAGFEASVVDKFLRHDISGVVLLDLQFEDLKELDITSYGKRHRVMSSIQHLRNSSTPSFEHSLSRSNSKVDRQPRVLQRAPQPEEVKILAYQTENGLKSRSSSSQRRGRMGKPPHDAITPAESVSIVAIEQLLPKMHKCSKGEDCPKWQKQQRKLLRVQEDFTTYTKTVDTSEVKLLSPVDPTLHRPKSDAVPSVVASSDVLGPADIPPSCITPERLNEIDSRDPQENVRQFLNFQHMHSPSPANNPSPPPAASASFVASPLRKSPPPLAEHLRSLPKLTIPLEITDPNQPATAIRTPISALHLPNQMTTELAAQLQKDPFHYGGVASPADIYRIGTPFSATDIPVVSFPIDPLSRDVSQSVPPDMRYGSQLAVVSPDTTTTTTDPIRRPSSIQPSRSRRHPRQPSFTPSVAPVSESAPLAPISTTRSRPSHSSRHLSSRHFSSRPVVPPTPLPSRLEDVSHAGWMRKRRTTKLLRHEWQDNFFCLKGTQLAMHALREAPSHHSSSQTSPDSTPKASEHVSPPNKPIEVIDVDEYAIACSTMASSSKLSAAFKKSILGSGHRSIADEQAFAFSLIPESERAKKLFARTQAHHFSVKSRDERIEWMRDLMLAKALKRAGNNVIRNGDFDTESNLI